MKARASIAGMNLPPLRTLFFEDLSQAANDAAVKKVARAR
jgi:hypothetical protein